MIIIMVFVANFRFEFASCNRRATFVVLHMTAVIFICFWLSGSAVVEITVSLKTFCSDAVKYGLQVALVICCVFVTIAMRAAVGEELGLNVGGLVGTLAKVGFPVGCPVGSRAAVPLHNTNCFVRGGSSRSHIKTYWCFEQKSFWLLRRSCDRYKLQPDLSYFSLQINVYYCLSFRTATICVTTRTINITNQSNFDFVGHLIFLQCFVCASMYPKSMIKRKFYTTKTKIDISGSKWQNSRIDKRRKHYFSKNTYVRSIERKFNVGIFWNGYLTILNLAGCRYRTVNKEDFEMIS